MGNIIQTKALVGKMDKESSIETINQYDHLDAHNIRNTGNENNDENYVTALEGTRLITQSTPVGQNKAVGGARFESVGKAYYVRQNSAGYHQIVEFDYSTEQEFVLFENLTDSGGLSILDIDANTFFNDIKLVDNKYLLLNDGVNPIFNFDIEYLRQNRGGGSSATVFRLDDIVLAKKQNLIPPTVEYLSDPNRSSNSLRGNLFQFRTQYVYKNFEKSSYSTVSKRVVPTQEPSDGQGQLVNSLNCLKVSVILDSSIDIDSKIDSINIAFRTGTNNWLLVKQVSREHIINLPDTNVVVGSVNEAYDSLNRVYSFIFYNDGTYPILDQIEVNNPYDAIPNKAEAIEVINGNVLAIGGITTGYERPELDNVNISVTYYADNIQNSQTGTNNPFRVSGIETINYSRYVASIISFSGAPKAGDLIILKLIPEGSVVSTTRQYEVTSTDEANGLTYTLDNAIGSLNSSVPAGAIVYKYNSTSFIYQSNTGTSDKYHRLDSAYVKLKVIGSLTTQSFNTIKTNSSYQVALFYFDKYGKYFPVVTDDRFIVRTDSLAKTEGLLPQINWTIQEDAPKDAVSYQWGISENQTFLNYITLLGIYETSGSDSEYLTLNITSLRRFNQNEKESSVTYDFTKGDKVTLIQLLDGSGNLVKWFRYPFIELDIIDFKIEVNPNDQTDIKYLLKVRNTDLLDADELSGKDIVMELWTPKGRSVETNSEVFYEIGEQYPIVNGKHTQTFGTIKEADAYFRGRLYASGVTENAARAIKIEDANFSDNYESKYWSAGRARTYGDEVGRVEYPASIRYSSEYKKGSKTYGFNTFYLERIYGEQGGQTSSVDGWIRKMILRNNGLMVLQERKVNLVPNYRTIVYDNNDQGLVADSGKIFGSVQPRIGNYGVGNAKESVCISKDSVIYFIDPINCVPVRDSYSGLDVIDVGMTHYFINHIQDAINRGSKLIGYFDELNREYNVTSTDIRGLLTSLSFKDSTYADSFPINYNLIENLEASHGVVVLNPSTGITEYTPEIGYVGEDEIEFDYFGKHVTIPVTVEEGDPNPDPFTFVAKTDQLPSIVIESNQVVVAGTNMPSTISITNGEYSINNGSWSNVVSLIYPNDSVKVRHTTAATPDTDTITTLTIGNVSAQFKSTTSETATEYLDIIHSIIAPDPQTGTKNRYGVKVELSHRLNDPYSSRSTIVYKKFNSNTIVDSGLVTIPAGNLSVNTGYIIVDADPTDAPVNGSVYHSTLSDGQSIECEDGITRIVRLNIDFTNQ